MKFTAQSIELPQAVILVKVQDNAQWPEFFIQAIDSYRYQRELTIKPKLNAQNTLWEVHAYRHPGVRHICEITCEQAHLIIARLLEISTKYPVLLWNEETQEGRARHEGFVHFHDLLLQGNTPVLAMLR